MKIKVQLVLYAEDGREEQVQEVAMVEKPHQPFYPDSMAGPLFKKPHESHLGSTPCRVD